jgi:hypothetical protein
MARLGFMNYLFSPSHAAIMLTQNFSTAIPRATALYGARATPAFARSMKTIIGPAFMSTFRAHIKPGQMTGRDVLHAILKAIEKSPTHGKWVRGGHIQQLMDRGVITSTFSNELGEAAKGENPFYARIFEYARLAPHFADVFNRTTTALAGLELTNGDIRKTSDLVNETHIRYDSDNQPRAFKALKRIPVIGPSTVMFKTYMQGMAHLFYASVKDSVMGAPGVEGTAWERRAVAAKTVAGMVIGAALFTGLKGATPELVHLGMYAYHKIFGDKDEFWSFNNAMHGALKDMLGGKGGDLAFSGLPQLAGVDFSNRMGLAELFLHDPPDLLPPSADKVAPFALSMMGTFPGYLTDNFNEASKLFSEGRVAEGIAAGLPVKMAHSLYSAFNQYNYGATRSTGNMLVEPGNKWGAAMQAFGLKPAALAAAQEKQSTAIEYHEWAKQRRSEILGYIINSGTNPDGSLTKEANDMLIHWDNANPDRNYAITGRDIGAAYRQRAISEQSVKQGIPDRNSAVRRLNRE